MDTKPKEDEGKTADTSTNSSTDEGNSLEGGESTAVKAETLVAPPKKGLGDKVRGLITHLNIYLILFIVIVILSIGVVLVAFQTNKKATKPTTITTQPLSTDAINEIKDSEAKVGDPKQTLTIESNSIFSGKVLIKDSLDVAGTIKVGGALSLPGISVSGTSNFDQLTANNLAVAGNASVQGQLTVQKGITTSAGATFGGPISAPLITAQAIQLTGDMQVTRHIDAGGSTPGKSDGSALGNGGTSSISGTDTAGTVTINTGGSPATGCFVTITFAQRFSATPHVVITPVGSAAAALNYYINRSTSNFSICSTNAAPAGQTFSFDYIAID